MNTILVFVALLGFALCDVPLHPQPPEPLPEVKKPEGMMEGKRPGRRGPFGRNFDNLSEEEKAELEKKREEIKKEVREKMSKLIEELKTAMDKQTEILDDKSLSRKDKLKALRALREENPKVYNVLKAILHQFVPKHKFGRRRGPMMMMMKPRQGWQKGPKEGKNKPFGPMKLAEPPKPEVPVKA